MVTTPKGVPYPASTDPNNVPLDLQRLADWVDARPGVAPLTTAQRDALAGVDLWNGRVIYNLTTLQLERYDTTGTPGWRAAVIFDHGLLTGLADDDHPQYVLHTELTAADYATKAEADSKVAKAGDTMTGGLTVDSGIASVRLRPQTAAVVSAESTTSTAFVGLATFGPAVTVETAASGRLRVSARAWLKNNTAGAASLIGVRVTRDTDNVVVVSPTDDLSAIAFSTSESSKELDLTYDLVANTRYRVELNYRVNSGTGTFQYRRLTAQAEM